MQGRVRFLLLLFVCAAATGVHAQVSSDFTGGNDNWSAPNSITGLTYNATGGNPTGNVSGTPYFFSLGAGTVYYAWHFVAPPKFLGNKSAYYNGTLRYEIQLQTAGALNAGNYEVMIGSTSAADTVYYFPPASFAPTNAWSAFFVNFNNSTGYWKRTNSATAPVATEAQIQKILLNMSVLQIRGLYRDANISTRLDNVSIMPPIVITTQPASTAVCAGATATLSTAATGNPAITYQWQITNVAGVWSNVTNGGPYSGATTAALSVNTTGNAGAGTYRCQVSGSLVTATYTNQANVGINTPPTPPTTTGANLCAPGPATLNAAGGTAGQYRWYTTASLGTAIPGATAAAYTTPSLSVTTNYYVAVNNGTCESTRTTVIATVNTPPAPPTTTGASSCVAASVTLTASGAVNGSYVWYPVATGGTPLTGPVGGTYQTPVISTTTTYYVSINNGVCESTRTPVIATIGGSQCNNKPPVFQTSTVETIVAGTATLDLSTLISDPDNNVDLKTLTIVTQPTSGAKATINGSTLTIDYAGKVFTGVENIGIRVCDSFGSCVTQILAIEVAGDIEVFNAVSPGKNGKNDILFIQYIDLIPSTKKNHVSIFNRWGDLVWEGDNYDNTRVAFSGRSKINGELPSGTYFYKIDFEKRPTKTGFLEIRN